MLVLISLICFFLIRASDNTHRKVLSKAVLVSMGLQAVAIDLSAYLIDGFYDLGYKKETLHYYFYFVALWFPVIFLVYVLAITKTHDKIISAFPFINRISMGDLHLRNSKRYRFFALFLFGIAFIALVKNLGNVLGVDFENSREYELQFGQNSIINYLFLLSTICVVYSLIGLKYSQDLRLNKKWIILLRFSIVVFSIAPIFHGIKATPIHQWILTLFLYYYLDGKTKYFAIAFSLVIASLIIFFSFVRGGSLDGIYAYLLLGYINLYQLVGDSGFTDYFSICDFSNLVIPFSYINSCSNDFFWVDGGFVYNDRYNHFTALQTILSSFGYLSWLWVSFLFFLFMIFDALHRKNLSVGAQSGVVLLVLIGATFVGFALFFFSYTFFTLKWWWYLSVAFAAGFFVRKKFVI